MTSTAVEMFESPPNYIGNPTIPLKKYPNETTRQGTRITLFFNDDLLVSTLR